MYKPMSNNIFGRSNPEDRLPIIIILDLPIISGEDYEEYTLDIVPGLPYILV